MRTPEGSSTRFTSLRRAGSAPDRDRGYAAPVDRIGRSLDRTGYVLEVEDPFDAPALDESLWVPRYLPHWTSADRAESRYEVGGGTLRLRIDADQPAWSPEHTGGMRVSALQTGAFGGPVGSPIGQNRTHDAMVVQQAVEPIVRYTPTYGLFELRASFFDDPTSMAALWMIGYADEPDRTGEICIAEVFGRGVGPDSAGIGMGTRRFEDPSLVGDFSVERVEIDAREPHWYAAEWTPDRVAFYVDERLVKVVPESPAYPMQLMLGLFEFREPEEARTGPYPKTFEAFAIRCYRRDTTRT